MFWGSHLGCRVGEQWVAGCGAQLFSTRMCTGIAARKLRCGTAGVEEVAGDAAGAEVEPRACRCCGARRDRLGDRVVNGEWRSFTGWVSCYCEDPWVIHGFRRAQPPNTSS